ncbi:Chondroitin sulfate ABC exolyase [Paramuricea clavata]|uniref:Chondroitin sulfate ABC exolyase n=1 Tax=Paramuricea clavata TaxID=317549 RepID=A0A7D9HWE8_PARCT|nr:Chondroitin sulfate ABC exolyase [Paramuricea clavata]
MSLNFVGWRAAWVKYMRFIGCPLLSSASSPRRSDAFQSGNKIDQLILKAPSSATSANPLYIDLLRFVQKISKDSRDSIVPTFTYEQSGETYCFSCIDLSKITEEIALSESPRKAYWQHKYRWSLRTPSPEPVTEVDSRKLNDINQIERRLENWYSNESKTFTRIPYAVSPSDPFPIQRWDKLLKNFDRAQKTLIDEFEYPPTSGLFARNSEYGGGSNPAKKFSELFNKVLHPLTLEYHIKSRVDEVNHTACLFAQKYTCDPGGQIAKGDIFAITGKDSVMRNSFKTRYRSSFASDPAQHPTCTGVSQACFDHVVEAIDDLNESRKTKIFALFDYIKDQGWDTGSSLGSMDHELLGMSGFAHSVFLLRNELKAAGKLDNMIDVMKWYVEFGEVYQSPFEFQGTTADKIRTVLLFRLMTVLIMPEDNVPQKTEKIRDMDALKRWIENALKVSEGLSDFIKPDSTSYHHRLFYGTAYCPSALHNAALISYLLDGTTYELDSEIKENLVNALKVFRIAAVHYSTPSQIGGRNPKYDQAIIAEHVPAYAYLAMKSPFQSFKIGTDIPNLNIDLEEVRMFLRLYQPATGSNICTLGKLNEFLCKGEIGRKYYLNTLGALEILERVNELASTTSNVTSGERPWEYQTEESPSGHWTKQFASLSIHRRGDWAVSVKGFDKFVVDFESSMNPVGNLYGMYSSHGAMLIANSESALSSKDVDNGWDWRKIPGTTVINVSFPDMRIDSSHHYNPSTDAMAGGVALKGSQDWDERNGVFGMNFEQPRYKVASLFSPFSSQVTFRFKKSVFFYDDLIVSLGSSIEYSGGNKEIHTALFQDKMAQDASRKPAAPDVFRCNGWGTSEKTHWENKVLVTLVDVNGNRYYIPNPDTQGLVFSRNKRQDSVKGNVKTATPTNGMYCTAWFNHGRSPSTTAGKDEYEYAVQVDAEPVGESSKPLLVSGNSYSVILKTNTAHVVKFPSTTNKRGTVYGYVVFPINPANPVALGDEGPLLSVLNQTVIMTEEKAHPARLHISASNPQLNLKERQGSPSWCKGGNTSPRTKKDVEETLLFCSTSTSQAIHVNFRENAKWSRLVHLYVGGKDKTGNKEHYLVPTGSPRENAFKFINMRNGADTEVEFSAN